MKAIVIVQRGRPLSPKRTEYGKAIRKDYEKHRIYEHRANMQRFEPREDGICNTITTVQKDNLILRKVDRMATMIISEPNEDDKVDIGIVKKVNSDEKEKSMEDYLHTSKDGEQYGIFRLSPRECGRLMGCNDKDITKMLNTNSWTQCYKQYGNSIVVTVLMGIFSQLNIKGVPAWNDLKESERMELIKRTTRDWEEKDG